MMFGNNGRPSMQDIEKRNKKLCTKIGAINCTYTNEIVFCEGILSGITFDNCLLHLSQKETKFLNCNFNNTTATSSVRLVKSSAINSFSKSAKMSRYVDLSTNEKITDEKLIDKIDADIKDKKQTLSSS